MRIFDKQDNLLESYDASKGHLENDRRFVCHHEAIEAVPEEGHWKTVAEYPNGGKDVEWIIDVPGVEAKEAWDEYEDILRFVEFSGEELAAIEERKRQEEEERKLQEQIRNLPGKAVTWDDLAKAIEEGVNSI